MNRRRRLSGFSLAELLVVIGVIALLVSVLIPVLSVARRKGREADTKNFLGQLSAAIERYQQDFRAYPGPIPNNVVWLSNGSAASFGASFQVLAPVNSGFDITPGNLYTWLTSSENLALGLLGGLRATANPAGGIDLVYDPTLVGQGPQSLNPNTPKRVAPYVEATNLSWRTENGLKTGKFVDGAGKARDTLIPEFVDRFPGQEMPILYLRSKVGSPQVPASIASASNNSVITNNTMDVVAGFRAGPYDLSQILGYTGFDTALPTFTPIGEGKRLSERDYVNTGSHSFPQHGLQTVNVNRVRDKTNTANFQYPYDAYPYFENPATPRTARNKDGYILISAGADRVYGTNDDIVSFGSVSE